jgi:type I restriction enzyme M protein
MVDASKGFRKDGPKNRLREQDLHKIVDTFTRQADVPRYARMVPLDEIADPKNDFNLNLPRYIDSTEPEDLQDIDGHLRGGIPERDLDALDAYWKVLPSVRGVLFEAFDKTGGRPGYARLKPALTEVKPAILGHAEFSAFQQKATKVFADWRTATTPRLTGFGKDGHPKALIETIAEDLLTAFRQAPLLDAYDIYQHLMDYWAETMQDDAYLIAADGWVTGAQPREIVQVKDKNNKLTWPEPHDYLKGKRRFKSDLVPAPILVARYFVAERDAIEAIDNQLAALEQQLEEMREEHGGEEGALKDVSSQSDAQEAYRQALVVLWNEEDQLACSKYSAIVNKGEEHEVELRSLTEHHDISVLKNKGKVTLKAIKARLNATSDKSEQKTLQRYLEVDKQQKAEAREAATLLAMVAEHYRQRLRADPLPEALADFRATVSYLELLEQQSEAKKKRKAAQEELDKKIDAKYPKLTEAEIKTLVVNDKWMARLSAAVQGELDRVSQTLTGRIRQLAERYATPLPKLTEEVETLAARVKEHLEKMGAVWK